MPERPVAADASSPRRALGGRAWHRAGDDQRQRHFPAREQVRPYVLSGARHRLENPGKIDLELIEIQTGSYLGEDDIVRLEDDYHRS